MSEVSLLELGEERLNSHPSSVNSQNYSIPVPDNVLEQLRTSESSSGSETATDDEEDNQTAEVTDSDSVGMTHGNESEEQEIRDDDDEDVINDELLDTVVDSSKNNFEKYEAQDTEHMFDASKYIFNSLVQAINSADFSESLSLQTKTSAVINSKSLELKQLIDSTKTRLTHMQGRFERGAQVSRKIKYNLKTSNNQIVQLNGRLRTEFPIEFNQARDKILERTKNPDSDSQ